jgi:hypothetical protein
MTMFTVPHLITGLTTAAAVVVCVLIHYEGLRLLSELLPKLRQFHRRRVVIVILFLLLLHVIEVWVFGGAYFLLLHQEGFGELIGAPGASIVDCVYYSAAVFTTVGFGDLYPVGAIRVMTGTEGIVGLTMITWSASYTFVEMLKTWDKDD